MPEQARVHPLRGRVIVYVNGSEESRKALKLLDDAGILYETTKGPVEPWEQKPLLVFRGATHEGVEEIEGMVRLLQFWSGQPMGGAVFVEPT